MATSTAVVKSGYSAGATAELASGYNASTTAVLKSGYNASTTAEAIPDFTPFDAGTVVLWLDADDIYGDDGDAQGTSLDKSGNDNDFSEATTEKQPILKTGDNGINGHNILRFDGTDDLLTASNFSTAKQGTVFIVGKLNGTMKATQCVLGSSDEATAGVNYWNFRPFVTDYVYPYLTVRTSSNNNFLNASHIQTFNLPSIWMLASNDTSYTMRSNGRSETISIVSGSNNGAWWGDVAGRDNFTLGATKWSAETAFFKGDIAEVIIYDAQLSAADILRVEDYLARKYAIPLGELDGGGLVLDDGWRTDGDQNFSMQEKVGVTNPVLTYEVVTDYPNCFSIGDPFIVIDSGIYYMFHKVSESTQFSTAIAYSTSLDGLTWTYQKVVIDEIKGGDHDLYFPHVFKAGANYFMFVGITRNELVLFRCTRFPDLWVVVDVIIDTGYPLVNVVPVYCGGYWYLFGVDITDGQPRTQRVYYSDKLYGGTYTEHPSSPTYTGVHNTAPVGRPIVRDNSIDMFLYDGDYLGGEAIRHYSITTLSPTEYVAEELAASPLLQIGDGAWETAGHHTMDRVSPSLTYADGIPNDAIPGDAMSIGIFEDVP